MRLVKTSNRKQRGRVVTPKVIQTGVGVTRKILEKELGNGLTHYISQREKIGSDTGYRQFIFKRKKYNLEWSRGRSGQFRVGIYASGKGYFHTNHSVDNVEDLLLAFVSDSRVRKQLTKGECIVYEQ